MFPIISRFTLILESTPYNIFRRTVYACPKHHSWNVRKASESLSPYPGTSCGNQAKQLKADVDEFDNERLDFDFIGEDPSKLKRLKVIQLQLDLWRQRGITLPKKLDEKHWLKLLSIDSDDYKLKYLNYILKLETIKIHTKRLRAEMSERHKEFKSDKRPDMKITTSGPVAYALSFNTLFHRIYDHTIERFYNYRVLKAASFGPHLVVDCGLRSSPTFLAQQIIALFNHNRYSDSPYNIIYCNFCDKSELMRNLRYRWKLVDDPCLPFHYTSESYTELFPKEKIVYITPSSRNILEHYNHDDIYVIPAVSNHQAYLEATSKVKKENLRSVRFPTKNIQITDRHLFTPMRVVKVLDDFRTSRNWNKALKHLYNVTGNVDDDSRENYFCDRNIQSNIYDRLLSDRK